MKFQFSERYVRLLLTKPDTSFALFRSGSGLIFLKGKPSIAM
jgi:hypothetical protein